MTPTLPAFPCSLALANCILWLLVTAVCADLLSASVRDCVGLDAATSRLRSMAKHTMQPTTSVVWLRPAPAHRD